MPRNMKEGVSGGERRGISFLCPYKGHAKSTEDQDGPVKLKLLLSAYHTKEFLCKANANKQGG